MEKLIVNTNLREQIYDILKNMIVHREIRPGEKINEEQVAKETGVSRTPIREALCRLENENIIEMIPRRGAFVIRQTETTVREVLEIREVLEGLVARLATIHMDDNMLGQLTECLEKIRLIPDENRYLMKYTQSDIRFHSILLEACRNSMLQNMMATINTHLQIIRLRTVVLPGRAKKTVDEHYEILKAIETGDENKAETMMRKHVVSVRRDSMKNLDSMV
ncbi:MAG TPA: GntR family transcriptional regulator [Deltaproteobacteria bacterium]|nr:GntR family transcriptional regulator [Deltaproteobacteria bacterium]